MKKKPVRSWHSYRTNKCVKNYYLDSLFFNRIITRDNYLEYLKLIALQALFLFFYFFIQIHVLEGVKETCMIGHFFEAIYYLQKDFGLLGYIGVWFYLYILFVFGWTLLYLGFLIYGICYNLTFNEIYNQMDLAYLYKTVQRDLQLIKIYKNPNDTGSIRKNIKKFFEGFWK
jgi:hypothetical protein